MKDVTITDKLEFTITLKEDSITFEAEHAKDENRLIALLMVEEYVRDVVRMAIHQQQEREELRKAKQIPSKHFKNRTLGVEDRKALLRTISIISDMATQVGSKLFSEKQEEETA